MTRPLTDHLEPRLVAVVREASPEAALAASRRLVASGVSYVEITCTVPDFDAVVRELADVAAVTVGVGTVLHEQQAEAALTAGARFLVSPVAPAFLVGCAREAGVLAVPGAATPSEIWSAFAAGAVAVKVFPVSAMGGPKYLRELAAPFPGMRIMASGGVRPADTAEYLAAGAWAVAIGSALRQPGRAAQALSAFGGQEP